MNIFDDEPGDWRDLQNRVGQLFFEMGCTVEIGKTIELVRGKKEIDVFVRDPLQTPQSTYLIECKFWNSAVPQEVVHSFRTIVADSGAHHGFIVSKAGFQSGSYEAARMTNIDLCTFEELQKVFFDRWKKSIALKYMPAADRIFPFWDPTGRRPPSHWGDKERARLRLLNSAYEPFLMLGPSLEMQGYSLYCLPLRLPIVDDNFLQVGEREISTYRQFYDFLDKNSEEAFRRYDELFAEIN